MRRTLSTSRLLIAAACGLCLSAPPAGAALLPPQAIDTGNGGEAHAVGASIGTRAGWAGFTQVTGGKRRFYVAFGKDARFRPPVIADNGKEVTSAGLEGNRRGAAIAFWTEKDANNKTALFGRRLTAGGRLGPATQISTPGHDASEVANAMFPFDRGRDASMNDAGGAVVGFGDATNNKAYAAILPARGNVWQLVEVPAFCTDIDARNNVLCFRMNGPKIEAYRIIGGVVQGPDSVMAANAGDQYSTAVGTDGSALIMGRDNNQHGVTFYNPNIATTSTWTALGPFEDKTLFVDMNSSAEDPFAALGGHGNGVIVWRDNANTKGQGYYRLLRGGRLGPAALLYQNATFASRIRPAVDLGGRPVLTYSSFDANVGFVRSFGGDVPRPALPLAPGFDPYTVGGANSVGVNSAGDFIALTNQFQAPYHVMATFGDYRNPTARPAASPRHPHPHDLVKLRARASDTLAALRSRDIRWTLPSGVAAARTVKGQVVKVRFARARTYRIKIGLTDRAGNRATKTFKITIR